MSDMDDDLFPPAETQEEAVAPVELEAQPAPEPEVQESEPEAAEKTVPLAALTATRDENKTLKARLAEMDALKVQIAQMQQPREPIRVDDPNFIPVLAQSFEQRLVHDRLQTSRFMAEREYGADLVGEAFEYFNLHPQESQALLKEASPFHAAVEHYKRQKVASEIGSDPEGYKARVEQEIRQKVLAEMAAQSVKQPSRGPSLAAQPNLGSRQEAEWTGPTSLEDILKG